MKKHCSERICIIGPPASGKSTLAKKLGQILAYPVLYLDQIAHQPGTQWIRRPLEETIQKHDRFIRQKTWIVEGNYSRMMPQRLARADMVIFLHFNRFGCAYRCIRRSLKKDQNRAGMLAGATDAVNWKMIKYILLKQPSKKKNYISLLKEYPHLTILHIHSFQQTDRLISDLISLKKVPFQQLDISKKIFYI